MENQDQKRTVNIPNFGFIKKYRWGLVLILILAIIIWNYWGHSNLQATIDQNSKNDTIVDQNVKALHTIVVADTTALATLQNRIAQLESEKITMDDVKKEIKKHTYKTVVIQPKPDGNNTKVDPKKDDGKKTPVKKKSVKKKRRTSGEEDEEDEEEPEDDDE